MTCSNPLDDHVLAVMQHERCGNDGADASGTAAPAAERVESGSLEGVYALTERLQVVVDGIADVLSTVSARHAKNPTVRA
jgi:hypothetical protein